MLSLALALAMQGGCSTPPVRPEPDAGTPVQSDAGTSIERGHDPAAEAAFAEAEAEFTAGRYPEAIAAFQLFAAEFPDDILVVRAELFIARSQVALGQVEVAQSTFEAIAEAPESDELRTLAALYVAYCTLRAEGLDPAIAVVDQEIERRGYATWPEEGVLPGDEPSLASLWAETLLVRGETVGAISALERVARSASGDDALVLYAYDRATEIAETRMNPDDLALGWADPSPFVRGTVAGALVSAHVDAGRLAEAGAVLADAGPLLTSLGLEARLDVARARVANASVQPLRWGIAVSLTGANRRAGRAALAGALLAQDAFSAASPHTTLLIEDAGSTVAGVTLAIEALVEGGAAAIVGPLESDLAAAARQAAHRAGVPFVSMAVEPFADRLELTWRLQADPYRDARAAVGVAMDRYQSRTFVLVTETGLTPDSYLSLALGEARRVIESQGGQVTAQLEIEPDSETLQDSARATAAVLATLETDALYLAVSPASAAALSAWMAAEDLWPATSVEMAWQGERVWLGNSFLVDDALLRDSSRYVEGMVMPFWFSPRLVRGWAETFNARFAAQFGRYPGVIEAFAFDASTLVRRLLQEGHATPATLGARLEANARLDGVTGTLAPDREGNLGAEPALVIVRDGAFQWLDGN
jgi:ABC-type branched-subunit amino acid transport system substrate-binding protein